MIKTSKSLPSATYEPLQHKTFERLRSTFVHHSIRKTSPMRYFSKCFVVNSTCLGLAFDLFNGTTLDAEGMEINFLWTTFPCLYFIVDLLLKPISSLFWDHPVCWLACRKSCPSLLCQPELVSEPAFDKERF